MPQIKTQNLAKALDAVADRVRVSKEMVSTSKLKSSQKELYNDKVKAIADKLTSPKKMKPIIISKDNYIVDGHHRWAAAAYKFGDGVKIPAHKIHLNVNSSIKLYKMVAQSIGEMVSELKEAINIPIEIGDTVLGGKFKNKRIVVKSISKNEKGDITINGRPLLKYRLLDESTAPNHNGKSAPYGSGYDELKEACWKGYKQVGGKMKNGKMVPNCVPINEIPMPDLKKIDTFADKKLNPVDVVITDKHFFDRLNDPRNGKEITSAELIGFFKRLSKHKKTFVNFLDKYKSVVAVDDRTDINIPFMKRANKAIAKTVMRKKDFKTPDKKLDI